MNRRKKKKRRKFERMMDEYAGVPHTYKEYKEIDRAYHEHLVVATRVNKAYIGIWD